MTARRISFVNFKGGVGKTSLSVNIAATLANELGQKVLIIDCDPQSNSSVWLMNVHPWLQLKRDSTVLALFDKDQPPLHTIIQKDIVKSPDGRIRIKNLDLIPATYELMEVDERDSNSKKPFYLAFYEAIANFQSQYDFIIYDCPPGLTKVCQSAIFASDEIFVPANPDELSRIGLDFLNKKLLEMEAKTKRETDLLPGYSFPVVRGIIYNAVNRTAKNDAIDYINQKVESLKKTSPMFDKNSKVFSVSISQAVALPKAISAFSPITLDKAGKVKDEYTTLSQYILGMKKLKRK